MPKVTCAYQPAAREDPLAFDMRAPEHGARGASAHADDDAISCVAVAELGTPGARHSHDADDATALPRGARPPRGCLSPNAKTLLVSVWAYDCRGGLAFIWTRACVPRAVRRWQGGSADCES